MKHSRLWTLVVIWMALGASWSVGILDRGYWTPDEPREADIAWRMSWQPSKAVPLLAGEAFCEKPPLTYWIAGAAMGAWGTAAWVARLPNLVYALVTALAVGLIGRRSMGPVAGLAAAAAIGTMLLSYQVAIWLATDAPLLAAVAVALAGLHVGYHATGRGERWRGYTAMHAALAAGFLAKSAAAWMVPVLTLATLIVWDRRWRELLRIELYAGLLLQALLVLSWVLAVYLGPDGPEHLKVFFWNNLAGRFAQVDAPEALQYASAHRNSPGKYLIELPVYLWPWTLLVVAAARRAWRQRTEDGPRGRPLRFAAAAFLPTLAVLSLAATARNIYLAPALPGVALLLGWWVQEITVSGDVWERRAMRATSILIGLAALVSGAAALIAGRDGWAGMTERTAFVGISAGGIAAALALSLIAWRNAGRGRGQQALFGLLLAYSALLVGPASQIYPRVDTWQNLPAIGAGMRRDAAGRPLILFAPDETTRAIVDMYTRSSVALIPVPVTADSTARLRDALADAPQGLVVAQLPGRTSSRTLAALVGTLGLAARVSHDTSAADLPNWASGLALRAAYRYELPNGRRYALLEATASR